MRVSVVVPTYRRPEALSRCLEALARQERAPDEIIVVVRREDEASGEAARSHGKLIRLVRIDVPADCPGCVRALKAGVAATTGDIVCLTDDDADARPEWISQILTRFAEDPSIGAVGGRDWIHHGTRLENGEEPVVGTVSWWGKTIGRHHLGTGPPRDVAILKGVNLSVRGDLVRQIGFDSRLLGTGTEHHWELGLCFRLLRMGHRIVYDPAVSVDHYPQPRVVGGREFGPREVRDSAHNQTLALLEHLSLPGQAAHLLWMTFVGGRGAPGLLQAPRLLLTTGDMRVRCLLANLVGRGMALLTYLRSTHGDIGYRT